MFLCINYSTDMFWPQFLAVCMELLVFSMCADYKGWNFNSGNYLFTTDTK